MLSLLVSIDPEVERSIGRVRVRVTIAQRSGSVCQYDCTFSSSH